MAKPLRQSAKVSMIGRSLCLENSQKFARELNSVYAWRSPAVTSAPLVARVALRTATAAISGCEAFSLQQAGRNLATRRYASREGDDLSRRQCGSEKCFGTSDRRMLSELIHRLPTFLRRQADQWSGAWPKTGKAAYVAAIHLARHLSTLGIFDRCRFARLFQI